MPALFPQICEMLLALGASPNYAGFYPTAYAISLCIQQQDRLLRLTKRLYPEVANHFNTNWKALERNIRTVVSVIWNENPDLLNQLASRHLQYMPRNAEFLAILSLHFIALGAA